MANDKAINAVEQLVSVHDESRQVYLNLHSGKGAYANKQAQLIEQFDLAIEDTKVPEIEAKRDEIAGFWMKVCTL